MSELHSETSHPEHGLTIRVKLVDLNHTGLPAMSVHPKASFHNGLAHSSSSTGTITDCPTGTAPGENRLAAGSEVCIATGLHVPSAGFENHIEDCAACNNRVELQLDFMQTLEVAVYQRKADPKSKLISGALLVSAPDLNFAICGELER